LTSPSDLAGDDAGGKTSPRRRLAEITEMIHTASLVHDVVDESSVRRGVWFIACLAIALQCAGDFLFAQSSWYLANLDNLEVVKLLSSDYGSGGKSSRTEAL